MYPVPLYLANYMPSPLMDQVPLAPEEASFYSNAGFGNVVAVDFRRKEIRPIADEEPSPWFKVAGDRLERLRNYQPGWDGPASAPINPEVLSRAGRLLELAFEGVPHPAPPAAVPCADGSLQLEWWLVDTRFELSIELDGSLSAWAENRLTNVAAEGEGKDATNLLIQWARRLTADKFVQPA